MRILPREAWRYTALLLLLFCIAGIAVCHVLQFLGNRLHPDNFRVAALLLWSLTLGFLSIAGAFGLWAIRFSAEGESRRRIARLVDAMYYIDDAILAIDRQARVRGANPAASAMAERESTEERALQMLFPCLTHDDLNLLTARTGGEIERHMVSAAGIRALRFRSQPSEGLILILVSDITAMNEQRLKRRQSTQLQLIGELARAVAHDFDSILCAIAGHAALLGRLPEGSPDAAHSQKAIAEEAERGVVLAGHLRQLAESPMGTRVTHDVAGHVSSATAALRDMLPEGWVVDCAEDAPSASVAFTGLQLEQTILQLGLAMAEAAPAAKRISIRVTAAPEGNATRGAAHGTSLLLLCRNIEEKGTPALELRADARAAGGLIVSVIRTLLEESGASLECLASDDGLPAFRANLPPAPSTPGSDADVPDELRSYIADWSVLCAGTRGWRPSLPRELRALGLRATHTDDVATALTAIEQDTGLDAAIFHERLLGQEPLGLLRAILKIRQSVGIVVVSEQPQALSSALGTELVSVPPGCTDGQLVTAIIESKAMAARSV